MAKVRSPNYPSIDLGAALESLRPAWKAEHRNKMSRTVLAKHMGYASLNGRALTKIGAVRAYGLIDGSGDELRISDDAVLALTSPDKVNIQFRDAMLRLATKPQLFADLRADNPAVLPSEDNLKFQLVQRGYTEDAAGKAAVSFLTTMRLVFDESEGYNPPVETSEKPGMAALSRQAKSILDRPASSILPPAAMSPMLQEVFNLDEGPVTLTFPSVMSKDSYEELEASFQLFLRRAKRRAQGAALTRALTSGIDPAAAERWADADEK